MKNKFLVLGIVFALIVGLVGCNNNAKKAEDEKVEVSQEDVVEDTVEEDDKEEPEDDGSKAVINYGVMTGPTGVGSVNLIEDSKNGESKFEINETIVGTPDEIVSALVSGNLDMAVIPANLASVLFNKTEGKIQALATNNLGVLYIVEIGNEIQSLEDLKGMTVVSTGKGATPETLFKHIMAENGMIEGEDWNFDFKSEAAEVAQNLMSGMSKIALLPEPMVTTVLSQNEDARIAINLEEEWAKTNDTPQITGVLVGRKEFLQTIDVDDFLDEYEDSIEAATENVEKTSELLGKYSIIKPEVAIKAIPNMNLHYMDKDDLRESLTNYLTILFDANPQSVGGSVPGEEFFYLGE